MTPEALARILALGGVGYLLGSVPVAWLIGKAHHGQDVRRLGSGNVGVLNTAISIHRWAGLLVFVGEIAKGVLAVVLARQVDGGDVAVGVTVIGAFTGTRWPVWLRFRGGRGNTLAAAALMLIAPVAVAILALIWVLGRLIIHTSFRATRLMLASLPIVLAVVTLSWWWAVVGATLSLLFLTTHRPGTDDHLLLLRSYGSVAAFLLAPRRRGRL